MSDLTGQQIADLRQGLQRGFPDAMRLSMFLREQLDRPLTDYASTADPLPQATFRVIEAAEAEGWLKPLVLAAYRARKNQPLIVKVANELGLVIFPGDHSNVRPLSGQPREASVIGEFQTIVNARRGMIDPADLRKILVEYPARVCKVELGDGGGTGFLIGPDLVLTNFHVMEPVLESRARAADVICRFDYSTQADGALIGAGIECRLAGPDWCVAKSPKSDWDLRLDGPGPAPGELDYCLIRLAERIGEARLRGSSDAAVSKRGWMAPKPRQSVGSAGEQLFILQHPRGAALKLAIGDHLGVNSIGNRFRYDVNTQKGSSGSPVFNARLELIGIHNSGWADGAKLAADGRKANQGIPISNIAALIQESGVTLSAPA